MKVRSYTLLEDFRNLQTPQNSVRCGLISAGYDQCILDCPSCGPTPTPTPGSSTPTYVEEARDQLETDWPTVFGASFDPDESFVYTLGQVTASETAITATVMEGSSVIDNASFARVNTVTETLDISNVISGTFSHSSDVQSIRAILWSGVLTTTVDIIPIVAFGIEYEDASSNIGVFSYPLGVFASEESAELAVSELFEMMELGVPSDYQECADNCSWDPGLEMALCWSAVILEAAACIGTLGPASPFLCIGGVSATAALCLSTWWVDTYQCINENCLSPCPTPTPTTAPPTASPTPTVPTATATSSPPPPTPTVPPDPCDLSSSSARCLCNSGETELAVCALACLELPDNELCMAVRCLCARGSRAACEYLCQNAPPLGCALVTATPPIPEPTQCP